MSILKYIQEKKAKFVKERKFTIQKSAEVKARRLEDKAKFATVLNKRLKRQEKARKEIEALKSTKERIRKQRVSKFKSKLAGMKRPGSLGLGLTNKPEMGLVRDPFENKSSNPWTDNRPKKNNPWLR